VGGSAASTYKSLLTAIQKLPRTLPVASAFDNEDFLWLHAMAMAFVSEMPRLFVPLTFQSALQVLADTFARGQVLTPLIALGAVGHITTFICKSSTSMSNSTLSLLKIPRDLLLTAKGNVGGSRSILVSDAKNNIRMFNTMRAVREALRTLYQEEFSTANKTPSYAAFSGLVQLMLHIGALKTRDLSTVRYAPVGEAEQIAREQFLRSLQPISASLTADNLEEVLRAVRDLQNRGLDVDGVNAKIAQARHSCTIWAAARTSIIDNVPRELALQRLESILIPEPAPGVPPIDAPARIALMERSADEFDEVGSTVVREHDM
jgi:hypothetical protein